jgi:putative Mg2+ transporter-C (MgtC) family protein
MHPMHEIIRRLGGELSGLVPATLARLTFAAILGGLIGLEREIRHKPAGLRTNLFICFGSAMFTILSDTLAGAHPGDHTRIAAQIIPGIGFIGAGSILHSRGAVTGLTTAATIFVVASVGMAAGGGLYLTAVFGTAMILIALAALGRMEEHFRLKGVRTMFEVTGPNPEATIAEVNRILDASQRTMLDIHATATEGHSRVVFSVELSEGDRKEFNTLLHESSVFSSVACIASSQHE